MVASVAQDVAPDKLLSDSGSFDAFAREFERAPDALPHRVVLTPEDADHGLAKLVLTLIELLRQLMERQAIARIEAGTVTDEQIERMGQTFMKLQARMEELKEAFGVAGEDLNLSLGPLGDLL